MSTKKNERISPRIEQRGYQPKAKYEGYQPVKENVNKPNPQNGYQPEKNTGTNPSNQPTAPGDE